MRLGLEKSAHAALFSSSSSWFKCNFMRFLPIGLPSFNSFAHRWAFYCVYGKLWSNSMSAFLGKYHMGWPKQSFVPVVLDGRLARGPWPTSAPLICHRICFVEPSGTDR